MYSFYRLSETNRMAQRLFLTAGINSTGYLSQSFRHGTGSPLRFADFGHYLACTRIAHAGRIDAVFLSDHPALMDPRQRPLHSFDPLILATALAAQVPDIGFELTVSSTYNAPYNLARRVASLDHISGGRVICNIVSSFNPAIAANFGHAPLPDRDARYRQAHEFMAVFGALLDSWSLRPADAADLAWDPKGAGPMDHEGEFFSVTGPLNVPVGPQRRPVIGQAGASDAGLDFAAAHGELIYCSLLALDAARAFSREVRARAVRLGRRSESLRILPGLVPILGRSRKEALERHDAISGKGSEAGLLRSFVTEAGLAPDFDPDAPLQEDLFRPSADQQRPIGFTQALADLVRHERVSARQFVRRLEGGHRLVIGTPDDVADDIIRWWSSGVVDGFNVQPPVLPDDLSDFVESVIPRLQRRGVFPTDYLGETMRERFDLPFETASGRGALGPAQDGDVAA